MMEVEDVDGGISGRGEIAWCEEVEDIESTGWLYLYVGLGQHHKTLCLFQSPFSHAGEQ
jgi:hypothetical protein